MDGLYHCIDACIHLGNSTGRRTVTMATLLLFTGGRAMYETVLHNNLVLCVCKGMCAGDGLD